MTHSHNIVKQVGTGYTGYRVATLSKQAGRLSTMHNWYWLSITFVHTHINDASRDAINYLGYLYGLNNMAIVLTGPS